MRDPYRHFYPNIRKDNRATLMSCFGPIRIIRATKYGVYLARLEQRKAGTSFPVQFCFP